MYLKRLTIGELFDEFLYALNQCGQFLLNCSDEMIGYCIFEEFDVCAGSYLHVNALNHLLEEGIIDDLIFNKAKILREKFFAVEGTPALRNVESIKTAKEWLEVMKLSDEIKDIIKSKWTDDEIKYLLSLSKMPIGSKQ